MNLGSQDLKGRTKAGNTIATPSVYLRFHVRLGRLKIEHIFNFE